MYSARPSSRRTTSPAAAASAAPSSAPVCPSSVEKRICSPSAMKSVSSSQERFSSSAMSLALRSTSTVP